mgnify:CR=1 FL=1
MKNNSRLHIEFLKHKCDLIKDEILHLKGRINIIEKHYNFIVENEECFFSANEVTKYLRERYKEQNSLKDKIHSLKAELKQLEIKLNTASIQA